jgi:aryl-phospho-beta-D-glucosidase BglC (GH1 family)
MGLVARVLAACALFAPLGAATGAAARSGPVVHVERSGARVYIADPLGRELLLRGTGVNGLIQYNGDFREDVPLTPDDFSEMAALGYSYLRLAISWSRVEPSPGVFDQSYLDQVAAAVKSAEANGLNVVVDFHQDRYNRHTWPGQEVDGAPDWATETDGLPCTDIVVSTLCAQAATQHFWNDDVVAGKPLQLHFLDALLAVSRRLRGDDRLVGIELLNEPTPGFLSPPAFERLELHPFYRRMIDGLRADGERRTIWFEPNILRDVSDADSGVAQRFSSDPNLVYAPHIYSEVFSAPRSVTPFSREHQQASFEAAAREAQLYGAPLVDGEWGGGAGGDWERYRSEHLDLEDQYLSGFAFWIWKQEPGFYDWHTVNVDGGLRADTVKAQQLSRPHPDAVPGHLVSIDWSTGRLSTGLEGPGGTAALWSGTVVRRGGPTLLDRPLTRVLVDGYPRRAQLQPVEYSSAVIDLLGYRVLVHVPAGRHTIVLE